jgi:uncharacterized protein YukE
MSWYGDPDGLDQLAARLAAAAARVRDRARDVRIVPASSRWRGPAADAFHASVFREGAALDRAADELDDAAAALHRHADAVRAEIARLLAVERAAERLLSAGVSTLVGLLP